MQASDRVLAGRYAAALFQAAAAKKEEQKVQADLGSAHKLLLDAMGALRHPRVPPASFCRHSPSVSNRASPT